MTRASTLAIPALAILVSCCAAGAQQIYWSQFGSSPLVGRMNLDGSGAVTSVRSSPFGMFTRAATNQVYWIESGDSATQATITRSNAAFGSVTPLISIPPPAYHLNLTADTAAGLVFWTDADNNSISRASLAGGPVLGTFNAAGRFSDAIAVDSANSQLYWTTQDGRVSRANYDGSNLTTLLTIPFSLPVGELPGMAGLYLDLPTGKMYMTAPNLHAIYSANLDGTGLQTVLTLGTERPFGLDVFSGRLYWTDLNGGRIRSANLDGSNITTLRTGLTLPRQVSIMVPAPGVLALLGGAGILTVRRRS